jgi:hypothetical protein
MWKGISLINMGNYIVGIGHLRLTGARTDETGFSSYEGNGKDENFIVKGEP